jgi:haloacetate dehalogenase
VTRLGIIEIVPTGDFWAAWNAELAQKAYHWTFLAQPAPLPERMIGADPVAYIDHTLRSWTLDRTLDIFPQAALDSYRVQARDSARIAAMCADYRAGATIDRALDEADRAAGRKIGAPLCFLWAEGGFPGQTGDPAALWRRWADNVTDRSCRSGHFVMEENPDAVTEAFLPFFSAG